MTKPVLVPEVQGDADAAVDLDYGILPDFIGYVLRRTQTALFADFARATEGFDLSPGQLGLLVLIEANPGINAVNLARAVGMDKSSLTPFVAKLEKRGLVVRERSVTDKRSFHIALTQFGMAFLSDIKAQVIAHEARLAKGLGAAKAARLKALLAEAESILRAEAQSA
jgi:DNA-binding MarR family transcriptional regulator